MAMTPDRWHLIERLYHEAHSRPAAERSARLQADCGDESVVREVEALLAQEGSADTLVSSVVAAAARQFVRECENGLANVDQEVARDKRGPRC